MRIKIIFRYVRSNINYAMQIKHTRQPTRITLNIYFWQQNAENGESEEELTLSSYPMCIFVYMKRTSDI